MQEAVQKQILQSITALRTSTNRTSLLSYAVWGSKKTWTAHFNSHEPVDTMHYSFDFAQQVHFPFDSEQTGPAYFKTERKCGIFGVGCEGKSQQVNYLIDEGENPSWLFVHHYLEKYGWGEKNLQLHADNCTGQNNSFRTLSALENNNKPTQSCSNILLVLDVVQ